jgi:hypothetical protein
MLEPFQEFNILIILAYIHLDNQDGINYTMPSVHTTYFKSFSDYLNM